MTPKEQPGQLAFENDTYNEVKKLYSQCSTDWKNILNDFEEKVIKARDEKHIPIYSTKCRVKTIDSIYLKTKRKKIPLDKITDYSGLRILCLFEEDILKIHAALLDILNNRYSIKRIKIYNFSNKLLKNAFCKEVESRHPGFDRYDIETKHSGYKSIHYIVSLTYAGQEYHLEIQVRTLLQDVWGELEHSLSYKRGMIHPHIKRSFVLLARDIETNDMLMGHLKEIHDKEISKDKFAVNKQFLKKYIQYEANLLPEQLNDPDIVPLYNEYIGHMIKITQNKELINDTAIQDAHSLYLSVKRKLFNKFDVSTNEDPLLKYWLDMESALILLLKGKYDDALSCYNNLLADHNDRYALHFRIGEIYFKNNEIVKALQEFDRSESLLTLSMSQNKSSILTHNHILIKRKLAYTYWLLGEEYIDIAISIMNEIVALLNDSDSSARLTREEEGTIINNICWFKTEKWQQLVSNKEAFVLSVDAPPAKIKEWEALVADLEKYERESTESYEQLSSLIIEKEKANEKPSSNWLDTAAYHCYTKYITIRDPIYKDLAQKYALDCEKGINSATLGLTSLSMQLNHLSEIMSLI